MGCSVRQRLLDRLRQGPATLRDLAFSEGLKEGETEDHLNHVRRSLAAGERLRETPVECWECGFVFRKRTRLKTPGRCPVCRSERIRPALLSVEKQG